jgi:hypothetical protein
MRGSPVSCRRNVVRPRHEQPVQPPDHLGQMLLIVHHGDDQRNATPASNGVTVSPVNRVLVLDGNARVSDTFARDADDG